MSTKIMSRWAPVAIGLLFAWGDMVAQQPAPRTVVISSGCSVASAGASTFKSTVGQIAIGPTRSLDGSAYLGFWYLAAPGSTSGVNDNRSEYSPSAGLTIQASPNPFTEWTEVRFNNATSGKVAVRVYDQLGKLVTTIADDYMAAGPVALRLDANQFPSGRFVVEVVAGQTHSATVLTVIK